MTTIFGQLEQIAERKANAAYAGGGMNDCLLVNDDAVVRMRAQLPWIVFFAIVLRTDDVVINQIVIPREKSVARLCG